MSKRIAVIADEPDSYYLIHRFAKALGLGVQQANGIDSDIQLIVFDIDAHPDWEALRTIQTDQQHIPVLLCSWQGEDADYPDDIWIDAHLQKPFLLNDFRAALEASGTLR